MIKALLGIVVLAFLLAFGTIIAIPAVLTGSWTIALLVICGLVWAAVAVIRKIDNPKPKQKIVFVEKKER